MNIAAISLYLPSGSKIGSGYQAHQMANAMTRRGHSVTMFSPCPRPEDARYDHLQVDPGRSFRTFRFAWRLRGVDFSNFDVLHAHGDDYWLWGLGGGRPIHVRTMHGSCFAEAAHVPKVWEKVRMMMLGLSEVLATCLADRTVCVSQNTRRCYPWVKDVISNGVDLTRFQPGAERETEPTVLFVGTYQNRKRGMLLMEEFARVVRPALPEAKLWMVCGDAPQAPGVTVFGRVSEEKLAELYRRAWVFCLPSSYEGFGVPYIEAMASGTPVVATPNVGAVEVLDGGKYGIMSRPEDLGREILDLLRNGERRERFAKAGLERAREFSWDRIIAMYEDVYASIRTRVGMAVERGG